MLTALLVIGVQLEGSQEGIIHYINPNVTKLAEVEVWIDAATQIFFSLSICMGGVITLASYNPFHNNTLKDSIIILVCNSLTSVFAGFTIFRYIFFSFTMFTNSLCLVSLVSSLTKLTSRSTKLLTKVSVWLLLLILLALPACLEHPTGRLFFSSCCWCLVLVLKWQ